MMYMFMSALKSIQLGAGAIVAFNLINWPLEYRTARIVRLNSTRLLRVVITSLYL